MTLLVASAASAGVLTGGSLGVKISSWRFTFAKSLFILISLRTHRSRFSGVPKGGGGERPVMKSYEHRKASGAVQCEACERFELQDVLGVKNRRSM